MKRRFEFHKRSQLFIRVYNESLSVVAMLHPQRTVLTSLVGVLLNNFYARGGRTMDRVGNDFTHPFGI
jgi:hypothetical protein